MAALCRKLSFVNPTFCRHLVIAVSKPDSKPDLFGSKDITQSLCLWNLKLSFCTIRSQSIWRFRMNMENNVGSCLMFYLLIMQLGAVEINPGPPKYSCRICNKNLADILFHARCTSIGPESVKALNETEVTWICLPCGISNISSHLSIDLYDLPSENSFQAIATSSFSKFIEYHQYLAVSYHIRRLCRPAEQTKTV